MPDASSLTYKVNATSELADDQFVLTQVMIKQTGVLRVVAPIARQDKGLNGQMEALVVMATGALAYIYPDSSQTGGWSVSNPVETTSAIEVVAGYQLDGNYYGFYQDGTNLYRLIGVPSDGPIAWTLDTNGTLPLASFLGVAYSPGQALAVYGLSGTGGSGADLVINYWGAGPAWTSQTTSLPSFNGTTALPQLGFYTGTSWNLGIVTTSGPNAVGYTYAGVLDPHNNPNTANGPLVVQLGGTQQAPVVVMAPFQLASEVGFFFGDGEGNLYCSSTQANTAMSVLSGAASFATGSGFTDDQLHLNLMLTDTDNNLWLVQQTGVSNGLPTFTPLIPLDTQSLGCFFDAVAPSFDILFGIDQNLCVKQLVQDGNAFQNGTIWRSFAVPLPSAEILSMPTYRSKVQIVDNYGTPQGGATVTVAVDQPVPLWWNGQCYLADPNGDPVTLTTDGNGVVTLAIQATDLTTANLTFAYDQQPIGSVAPHAPLQSFLAGQGSLNYAAGSSPSSPLSFTADSLSAAQTYNSNGQATGNSVAPALNGDATSQLSQTVTQAIQTGAQMVVTATQAKLKGHPQPLQVLLESGLTGMTVNLSSSAPSFAHGAVYNSFGGDMEYVLQNVCSTALSGLDSIWSGIKNGLADVEQFLIDIANGLAVFVATIGNEVYTFYLYLSKGIDSLIATLQCIFAAVEADIEDVINWLRALFDWQNFVNTKNQISTLLDGMATTLSDDITNLQSGFDGLMNTVESDFSTLCTTLQNNVGNETLSSLLSGSSQTALLRASAAGAPARIDQTTQPSPPDVHGSWLLDKLQTILSGSCAWQPIGGQTTQTQSDSLTSAIKTAVDAIVNELQTVLTTMEAAFSGDYGSTTVGDLLAPLESVTMALLQAAQTLVDALFDLATWAISQIGSSSGNTGLLGTQFNLLGIGALLNFILTQVGDEPPPNWPTIGDVVAWIYAVPLTVGYELITGNPPFPSQGDAELRDAIPDPTLWQTLSGLASFIAIAVDTLIDVEPTDEGLPTALAICAALARAGAKTIVGQAFTLNEYEECAMQLDTLLGVVNLFAALNAWTFGVTSGKSLRFMLPPAGPIAVAAIGLGQLYALLQSTDSRDQSLWVLPLSFYNIFELVHCTTNEYALIGKAVFNAIVSIDVLAGPEADANAPQVAADKPVAQRLA